MTSIIRSRPAPRTGASGERVASSPLDAIRAFGVMLGGPVVLLGAVIGAGAQVLQALRAHRRPSRAAVAILGTALAYLSCVRPWMRRWGATDAELEMTLPWRPTGWRAWCRHQCDAR